MTHLDANILIAAAEPDDPHAELADRLRNGPDEFACSSAAWMEFLSYPVPETVRKLSLRGLAGGILTFDADAAELAGRLFQATGSKRRTRLHTMIAATAILAGAELTTANPDDFTPFVAHGLKLHPLSQPAG